MRIAFVSYEYPPETGGGGIGTYLFGVSAALAKRGHQVIVICGGSSDKTYQDRNLKIQSVRSCPDSFANKAADVLAEECRQSSIDVVELTDYAAWGLEVQRRFPEVPSVVKLHTPSVVIDRLHWQKPNVFQRLRMGLGALKKGEPWPTFSFRANSIHEKEVETLKRATAIAATTQAVLERAARDVPEIRNKAAVYPYMFSPSQALVNHPISGNHQTVLYVGRLEPRKGVLDLAAAAALVRRRNPSVRFRFVGRDMASGRGNRTCAEEIRKITRGDKGVEILAAQPAERVQQLYGESDICCFPSHWESFGLVLLEAMAAGRAVIATKGSGMAEIIEDQKTGLLVEPRNHGKLAQAIDILAGDIDLRMRLGKAARARVLEVYGETAVLEKQEDHYLETIRRHKNRQ